jgi:predicted glycogen debranching enzyme
MFSFKKPGYEEGIRKEWIVPNGLGGYASSTIFGANTRKYHGLLLASLSPPVDRWLLLSKLEEIIAGDRSYQLSTNRYPGVVHPRGFKFLERFDLDYFPTFIYKVKGFTVEKKVFTIHGHNATVVSYEVEGKGEMKSRPLVNCRRIHSNLHLKAIAWGFQEKRGKKRVSLRPNYPHSPALILASDLAEFSGKGDWYRNMVYEVERERGYDDREDHYCPGEFSIEIEGRTKFHILAVGGRKVEGEFARLYSRNPEDYDEMLEKERRRKEELARGRKPAVRALTTATDAFIVKRGKRKSIIAGYHWFDEWGRDAMISLPGLTLVTKRYEDAKQVLRTFAEASKGGIIPNRFSEQGMPEYNTADASLWFVYAVQKYLEYTEDYEFVRELWPFLTGIIKAYEKGTEGIRMEKDALIYSSPQLTWMDTKIGDWVITPREGKAVEINALWYNALRFMEDLAKQFDRDYSKYKSLAELVKKNFNEQFWNEEEGCLYDVIGRFKDASIRPNQIFAVSLPHSMLSKEKEKKVMSKVEEELLTPYGLRSLSPKDSDYKGAYLGDQLTRDLSYHQGTVWPWLLGPFVTAYVKVRGKKGVEKLLSALFEHLSDAGIGTISEIFDGDAPHKPKGCISQAWSVAEILRCYFEDVRR